MYIKKKCVAMLLAGGQGSRLYALTKNVAKPAVPYGGKYRLIDFPLSNCTNSGIDTVGVLTQYQPLVLNDYIGNGQPWDLDKMNGGVMFFRLMKHSRVLHGMRVLQMLSIRICVSLRGMTLNTLSFSAVIISIRWTTQRWLISILPMRLTVLFP